MYVYSGIIGISSYVWEIFVKAKADATFKILDQYTA